MKPGSWPGRKTVVRLALISPQPGTTHLGNVRQVWHSSVPRENKGNDFSPVSRLGTGSPVFELVPLEILPAFDASTTLKTMLLTQDQIRRLNAFKSDWRQVIAVMLQLGNLLMLLTTVASRRLGSVMAVLAPFLQSPGMMFILASIRIEMLYLLLRTYDFWYFTFNNVVFGICFTAMFRDVRVIIVFVGCVIVQISIGADALVGDRQQLFTSSAINCATHVAMFIAVFLKLVDDNGNGDAHLLSYSSTSYGFSVRDTLMNTQLNMILLFGRLVYRNWVAMAEQGTTKVRHVDSQTSYIPGRRRCVSYYCTVGLRQKSSSALFTARDILVRPRSTSPIARTSTVANTADSRSTRSRAGSVLSIQALDSSMTPAHMPLDEIHADGQKGTGKLDLPSTSLDLHQRRRTRILNFTKIQLQFVPIDEDFKAYKTLLPGFGRLLDRMLRPSASYWRRRVLLDIFHTLGYIGMGVLVLGALVAWISEDQNLDNIRPGLARTQKLAFFASLVFCGVFFAAYQRQLLFRLYSSFNFLFLSTKLTVASLALCQFFAWDRRVVWVWGAWLWMQWAITLDALPPSTMRLLNFRRSTLMMFVLAFELTGLIILWLELFTLNRWVVPNRTVIDKMIMGRHIQLSTLSALVSRLWTIFLWDCKIIWFLTAALRRQRHRRLFAIDTTGCSDDDEGERLLLTDRVEFFYKWASQNRQPNAKSRWSRGYQLLRVSQAFIRRRTKRLLHIQDDQ